MENRLNDEFFFPFRFFRLVWFLVSLLDYMMNDFNAQIQRLLIQTKIFKMDF